MHAAATDRGGASAPAAAFPPVLKSSSLNTATAVELIGVDKWFGQFHVLRDVSLKVSRGEKIVICGPSGSGKSTMIRCINRLEDLHGRRPDH
jgi:general L-amino acid transport system ATP-binding protein